MKLEGLEISGSLRLQQPDDVKDILVSTLKSATSCTVHTDFYKTFFFSLPNGAITGSDSPNPSGFKIKLYDVDNAVVGESDIADLDWYTTEDSFFSEISTTKSFTLASDIYLAKFEIIYVGDIEGVATEKVLITSEELGKSVFAEENGEGKKGILFASADGDLTLKDTILSFKIKK